MHEVDVLLDGKIHQRFRPRRRERHFAHHPAGLDEAHVRQGVGQVEVQNQNIIFQKFPRRFGQQQRPPGRLKRRRFGHFAVQPAHERVAVGAQAHPGKVAGVGLGEGGPGAVGQAEGEGQFGVAVPVGEGFQRVLALGAGGVVGPGFGRKAEPRGLVAELNDLRTQILGEGVAES